MYCIYCKKKATDKHHVIYKSQGGTNNKENLAPLCREHHNLIHHGINTKEKHKVLKVCYDYIKPNIDKCWSGKIKPKIVNKIEGGLL